MKGTLPQKVCQSVDGLSNAPAARSGASNVSSKQTQPETNRRVGSAAAAIGLVAISSLFMHQKSDRAMAAEPVGKAPAIGTGLGSAATETPTMPATDFSGTVALGAVTSWFSDATDGHEWEWSPALYWSGGEAQPQFQISVEETESLGFVELPLKPRGEVIESSSANQLSGYERFDVNQTVTRDRSQPITSQVPQLLTSTAVLSDFSGTVGTDMVPFMVSQSFGPDEGLVTTSRETSVLAPDLAGNVPSNIPEMTSVHPIYVDGLRAEIQGLREKYHVQERSRDRQYLETPRIVATGLGSEQMGESPSPLRNRHRVMPGETLAEISRQYDVSIPELIEANQLTDENQIKVNQLLNIPPKRPASSFGFARAESSTFNNALETAEHNRYINRLLLEIKRRQQHQENGALLPAVQPEPSPAAVAPPASRETSTEKKKKPETVAVAPMWRNTYDPLMPWDQTVSPQLPPLQAPDRYLPEGTAPFNGYIWPAKGTLTSGYGWRWGRMHRGIDIAGPIGTPILSAGSGVVDFAGWNRGGYGNLVEIRHPDGSLTRYAHNHRILVSKGQQVKQGQQIAEMGSTGYSTGPHLHFELHPSGKGADNPISYLPPRN
ncbi:MAG: peptidoglycan DD-metalloendopeptidase family protein [Hormoscilla sp.]